MIKFYIKIELIFKLFNSLPLTDQNIKKILIISVPIIKNKKFKKLQIQNPPLDTSTS